MKKLLAGLITCVCLFNGYSQISGPTELSTYFDTYSDELRGFRLAVIGRTDINTTDKYNLYIKKKNDLLRKFKKEREEEYLSFDDSKFCVSHSCTKGNSGGKKDCGWKSIVVPKGYKKVLGTFKIESGEVKQAKEVGNGGSIRQTKSSPGRISGRYCAEYKIDRAWLKNMLITEGRKLIGDIVASHKKTYPDEAPYW